MAQGIAAEISQAPEGDSRPDEVAATESLQEDMELDNQTPHSDGDAKDDLIPTSKRLREEEASNGTGEADPVSKKLKSDQSVEEKRLGELEEKEVNKGGEEREQVKEEQNEVEKEKEEHGKESIDAVKLGPKNFSSSVDMFDYFFKLLHHWQPNIDINEYEYMVLLDLLKKGHMEPDKKLGEGVDAFQVRYHPVWKSRCFFLIRKDGSVDDFSFRKCVDKLLPLPDNMKAPVNKGDGKKTGVHKKGGSGGHGHGKKGRLRR